MEYIAPDLQQALHQISCLKIRILAATPYMMPHQICGAERGAYLPLQSGRNSSANALTVLQMARLPLPARAPETPLR